jgi:hypothetical protein
MIYLQTVDSSGTPSRYSFLAAVPFSFNSQTGLLSTPALYIASVQKRKDRA